MFDFIPIEAYSSVFYNLTLVLVLITFFHSLILDLDDPRNLQYGHVVGKIFFIFILLYVGLRPIDGEFIDMLTYKYIFDNYASGRPLNTDADIAFNIFVYISSKIMTAKVFFFLCASLYIIPMYVVSRKLFGSYWFYSFLLIVASFSFWAYGVNGIRNGIATSLFFMAIAYNNKKAVVILFLVLSSMFHQSMLLPTFAYIVTVIYNNPKAYVFAWILAIPLSLILGGFWENLFAGLGIADDRFNDYLTAKADADKFAYTGFRWDFLIYSATAVATGWYFIFIKNFNDKLYIRLFNIYLITNAFWILIIRANFSNRFAYLSWFLIAIIIIYPFLRQRFFINQHSAIGKVCVLYFTFTYIMYLIYNS